MAKPAFIQLSPSERIAILYEDRSVLAIDKPPGWMAAPEDWRLTSRNLLAALLASIQAGDFWARSRGLRFLRYVHRLDAETSGVLLLAKSAGALRACSRLFASREMRKLYLAAVEGQPKQREWTCRLPLGPDPAARARMKVDARAGKPAETRFRVLQTLPAPNGARSLVLAQPVTGRTHQIRVHLAHAGHPVLGDAWYGTGVEPSGPGSSPGRTRDRAAAAPPPKPAVPTEAFGLRAVHLGYRDLFTRKRVEISAPHSAFVAEFGFEPLPEPPAALGWDVLNSGARTRPAQ